MHELRYDRAAAHDLDVKHSPCMCSYGGGGGGREDLIEPHQLTEKLHVSRTSTILCVL